MRRIHALNDAAADRSAGHWGPEPSEAHQFDCRRAIDRAFDSWSGLCAGRLCPSIEDLERVGVPGPRDVLVDLRTSPNDPELTCIGGALLADCSARGLKRLSEAPENSLLALLCAHHLYCASTRQPLAFEGERRLSGDASGFYRAILLPFSGNSQRVDFIFGRIGWRDRAAKGLTDSILVEIERQRTKSARPPASVGAACPWPAGRNAPRPSLR